MIITGDLLDKKVPKDNFPTRLDSALNLYTYTNNGLIVYNVNPSTWNCLYPFFELNHKFTIDEYEFASRDMTYGELIEEHQRQYKKVYEVEQGITENKRKDILLAEFSKTFGVPGAKITEKLESIYELKYSKSKDVWTLYYFENYIAGEIDDVDKLLSQNIYEQKFMLLDARVRKLDGLEVVSNLPYILENVLNVEKLKRNMLK